MNRKNKSLFEILAELTGEFPDEVESVISKSIQTIKENEEFVLISESFPCFRFSGEAM